MPSILFKFTMIIYIKKQDYYKCVVKLMRNVREPNPSSPFFIIKVTFLRKLFYVKLLRSDYTHN